MRKTALWAAVRSTALWQPASGARLFAARHMSSDAAATPTMAQGQLLPLCPCPPPPPPPSSPPPTPQPHPPPTPTASGAVSVSVLDRLGPGFRVLLAQRGRPPRVGAWTLPGGRIHPSEPVRQAAERELREETGLDARHLIFGRLPYTATDAIYPPRFHYLIAQCFAVLRSPELAAAAAASDDAQALAWLTLPEIRALGDRGELAGDVVGTLELLSVSVLRLDAATAVDVDRAADGADILFEEPVSTIPIGTKQ